MKNQPWSEGRKLDFKCMVVKIAIALINVDDKILFWCIMFI